MLTPLDIQKQDFAVSFRGYNADEVDTFLDMVGIDYEKLYKDNLELKEKVANLQQEVEQYKNMESALKDSILLAQSAAEEIKKNASAKADDMLRQTSDDIVNRKKELTDLQLEIDSYKSQVKSICERVCDLLNKI